MSAHLCNVRAACLSAALLFLLVATWHMSGISPEYRTHISHLRTHLHRPCQEVLPLKQGSFEVQAAKQQASIVIVVTSKESSLDRRSWLRNQFMRNLGLLHQQDEAAAESVVMKFAIGSQGGCWICRRAALSKQDLMRWQCTILWVLLEKVVAVHKDYTVSLASCDMPGHS
jgi:hypothetical protein